MKQKGGKEQLKTETRKEAGNEGAKKEVGKGPKRGIKQGTRKAGRGKVCAYVFTSNSMGEGTGVSVSAMGVNVFADFGRQGRYRARTAFGS